MVLQSSSYLLRLFCTFCEMEVSICSQVCSRLLSMRLALLPSAAKDGMYSDGSSKACALRTLDERFCVICTTTFCRSRSLGTVSALERLGVGVGVGVQE